jgi:hypothetical protein
MSKQIDALKLALEALDQLTNVADTFSVSGVYLNEEVWAKKCLSDAYFAITTIEEALAQQEGQSNYCLQCEALSRELAALKTRQSNEQSKCNHTKTITRADIDGNQIETTCGECGERVAQQPQDVVRGLLSNEQVEPVAKVNFYTGKIEWLMPVSFDIPVTIDVLPMYLYTHPPVPYVVEPRTAQPKEPEQNLKLMPREATPEMLKAMDECSMEGYDERLYEGHASSVYMAAWDAFHGQHCYCGDITNLGVIHRDDDPCHYPEHTSEYKRGYADAMNWKAQNHLEHLQPKVRTGDCLLTGVCASEGHKIQPKEPEQEPVAWRYKPAREDNPRWEYTTNHPLDMGDGYIRPSLVEYCKCIEPLYAKEKPKLMLEKFREMEDLLEEPAQQEPATKEKIREAIVFNLPLYTTPPQRTWVGLTDEEFQLIYDMGRTPAGMMEMVEAKIKEKNT